MRASIWVMCCVSAFLFADAYKAGVVNLSNKAAPEVLSIIHKAGSKNVDIIVLPADISNNEESYEEDAYKAGVVNLSNKAAPEVLSIIHKAGSKNVDIIVLPADISNNEESYEETVKTLSNAAKQAGLYLVAHLNENTFCQKKPALFRSNLVFDRKGAIVAVYRKPNSNIANCTKSTEPVSFETDFGITFDLMMEEDIVLRSSGLKNVVVAGPWQSEIPFLGASQFMSTWAYVVDANVLSKDGIFGGRAGIKSSTGKLIIADLKNDVDEDSVTNPPVVTPASIKNFPVEDLSQYIFKPLDVEASSRGLKETVCHNSFCCEFDVKTTFTGTQQEVNYGLAAFDGIRHYGDRHYIGTQNCAVFACAGLYKRSCTIGSINNMTNIFFESLTVSANFTAENSIQYPVIVSNHLIPADKFNYISKSDENSKLVTVEITDCENLFAFGIFGRDFENDYENSFENQNDGFGIYDYIFTEDLQEFFDYIWIRLRVLLFIVSIYFLEMM